MTTTDIGDIPNSMMDITLAVASKGGLLKTLDRTQGELRSMVKDIPNIISRYNPGTSYYTKSVHAQSKQDSVRVEVSLYDIKKSRPDTLKIVLLGKQRFTYENRAIQS